MRISVDQAVQKLNSQEPVAIPTETVYGLAARIDQDAALQKIFAIKKRPFFDPLIVHIQSVAQARLLTTEWPLTAQILAAAFWPGPLTLVLPKSEQVSPLITSGLLTVGLRLPRHPLALELLAKVGVPLAAPSANRFGRTSPTQAEHVLSEFADQVPVVDGGACDIGLESTVLSLQDSGRTLILLREGAITPSQIEKSLRGKVPDLRWIEPPSRQMAPGQMQHHYMPSVPLVIVTQEPTDWTSFNQQILQKLQQLPVEVEGVSLARPAHLRSWGRLVLSSEPTLAARELYQKLREAAAAKSDALLFIKPVSMHGEPWAALWNRLSKAASLIVEN
jgi:L-threonylcarbamoyladenylate synthase